MHVCSSVTSTRKILVHGIFLSGQNSLRPYGPALHLSCLEHGLDVWEAKLDGRSIRKRPATEWRYHGELYIQVVFLSKRLSFYYYFFHVITGCLLPMNETQDMQKCLKSRKNFRLDKIEENAQSYFSTGQIHQMSSVES